MNSVAQRVVQRTEQVSRKSAIAPSVRQWRTMTYEKSAAAKNVFVDFPVGKRAWRWKLNAQRASNAHALREMGGAVFDEGDE
jgi:hypothetical protein